MGVDVADAEGVDVADAQGVDVADAEGIAGRKVRSPEFRASGLNRNNY